MHSIFFNFPIHICAKSKPKITPFARDSSFFVKSASRLRPLRIPAEAAAFRVARCSVVNDKGNDRRPRMLSGDSEHCDDDNHALAIAKPSACAVLFVVFGFFCPVFGFCRSAVAAPPQVVVSKEDEENGQEYSRYTQRLSEVVTRLTKIIEEAKDVGYEDLAANVEEGLKEIKLTTKALIEEMTTGLHAELCALKRERDELTAHYEETVEQVSEANREEVSLMRKARGGGDEIARLREEIKSWEKEYNDISERIREIENLMEKRTRAVNYGLAELFSVERVSEAFLERLLKELRSIKTHR